MEFKDKVALVTGSARGIGKAIASEIARRGGSIVIVDVDEDAAQETARELGKHDVKTRAYVCDVSSYDAVERLGETVLAEFEHVDFLINNAGITRDRLLVRMTPEDWNLVISVNLTGAFNFSKVFSLQMLKRRAGRIVNIASVIGLNGNAGQANYAASKAGVIGLTKSLAREFAARGVNVNAIAPGFISTAMTDRLKPEVQVQMKGTIPLGRFGEARDVANVAVFLLSELSSYVTGQVINCDGGMITAR